MWWVHEDVSVPSAGAQSLSSQGPQPSHGDLVCVLGAGAYEAYILLFLDFTEVSIKSKIVCFFFT